jgi:predicted nucleotide-binding protein (sugar kinase/HSP70/actin superfamily)
MILKIPRHKNEIFENILFEEEEDSFFEYLGSRILENDVGAELVHSVEETIQSYNLCIDPEIKLRDVNIYYFLSKKIYIIFYQKTKTLLKAQLTFFCWSKFRHLKKQNGK